MTTRRTLQGSKVVAAMGVLALLLAALGALKPALAEPVTPDPAAARPLIDDGVNQFEAGNYAAAEATFAHAQQLDPAASIAPLYLGLSYEKEGRLKEAVATWRNYVTLAPSGVEDADLQKTMREEYLPNVQRALDYQEVEQAIARERAGQVGPGDPHTLAISRYGNLGSPDLTPYTKGLAALLIADAFKVPHLTVISRAHMQALIEEMHLAQSGIVDPTTAVRAGRLANAGTINTGSFTNPALNQMTIDSMTATTNAPSTITPKTVAGPVDQIFTIEKQLLAADLAALGYVQSSVDLGVWTDLQKPQTTSLPAFKAFSAGLDARDVQNYAVARTDMQQALTDDPNFELAKRELLEIPTAALTMPQVESSVSAAARSMVHNKFTQTTVVLAVRQGLPACPNVTQTVMKLGLSTIPSSVMMMRAR